jgi:signal-transduction protein with cAMP-binding, CBS, and nucleotidyltransferase domain
MYIILRGNVAIYKGYGTAGQVKVASLSNGNFFGEMSLFLQRNRTATAVAVDDVYVCAINSTNAYEFIEKEPESAFMMIKSLCARLEAATNNIVPEDIKLDVRMQSQGAVEPQTKPEPPAKVAEHSGTAGYTRTAGENRTANQGSAA